MQVLCEAMHVVQCMCSPLSCLCYYVLGKVGHCRQAFSFSVSVSCELFYTRPKLDISMPDHHDVDNVELLSQCHVPFVEAQLSG